MSDDLEDEDLETETPEEPEPPPEPAPRPKPRKPRTLAAPAPALRQSQWSSHDVEMMWPEMLAALKKEGKSPYDIDILVKRIDPPPDQPLGLFSGGAVAGTQSQGAAQQFLEYFDSNFHMPNARGPSSYEVRFLKRNEGNTIYGRTKLNRPDPAEIVNMRRARIPSPQMPAYMPPEYAGYGQPQAPAYFQQQAPAQMPQAPQAPLGAPPATPHADPTVAALQAQVGFLSGTLQGLTQGLQRQGHALEQIVAHLTNRPAPAAPVPVGTPPAPAIHESWLQPAPVPAVPAQQPQSRFGHIRQLLDEVRLIKSFATEVDTLFGAPGTLGAPAEVVEEPEKATTPFETVEIPGATLFGRPLQGAINKETKNIDWQGVALSNPQLIEKGVELASSFLQGVIKASGASAMDAPAPAAPAALGAAPTHANGASHGTGWPSV